MHHGPDNFHEAHSVLKRKTAAASHSRIAFTAIGPLKDGKTFDRSHYPLRLLLAAVGQITGLKTEVLKGPYRTHSVAKARFAYYYLARHYTSKGLPEIGRACGDRDHSTVIHGSARAKECPDVIAIVEIVKKGFGLT